MIGRRWFTPWMFLLPALVVALAFSVGPFANTVVLAFTNAQTLGGGHFTGLANFQRMVGDPAFWQALRNTGLYMLVVVPLMVVLPLLLALLVQRTVPGIGLFRAVFYSPVVASMVVVGLVWTWLLQSEGLVNWVLQGMRVVSGPVPFLTDSRLLLFSAMFVTVWKGLGYYMVVYLAALANVSSELHEAAQMDGAGSVRRLVSITLPVIRPALLLVGILSAISAAKVFAEIYVMSGGSGGPGGQSQSLVFRIREVGLGLSGETGYASAISLVLFVCTVGFSLVFVRVSKEQQ